MLQLIINPLPTNYGWKNKANQATTKLPGQTQQLAQGAHQLTTGTAALGTAAGKFGAAVGQLGQGASQLLWSGRAHGVRPPGAQGKSGLRPLIGLA